MYRNSFQFRPRTVGGIEKNFYLIERDSVLGGTKQEMLEAELEEALGYGFQVLREDGRTAQTKSYEWVYRTNGCTNRKIAVYDYQETRSQEHPKAFLKDFKDLLHTDGYQVYHNGAVE